MAARETGVVRQRLDGDTAAAQRLNSIARTQLGILKELMAFGGLQQLSRTVRLGDGTEIFVQSVFGQDTMRITPPVTTVEAGGGAVEAVVGGKYVYVAGTDGVRTYRWKVGVDGRRLISTIDVGVAPSDTTLLMSDDGSVIVTGRYDPTSGMFRVFRWTMVTGEVDIGVSYIPPGFLNEAIAQIQMSPDGSVIAVYGVNALTGQSRVYYWSAASGAIDIGIFAAVNSMVLSGDGTTIAAIGYVPNPTPGATNMIWAAFAWRGGVLAQIPTIVPDGNYNYAPLAISHDGSVVAVLAYPDATGGVNVRAYRCTGGGVVASSIGAAYGSCSGISLSADGSTILFLGSPDVTDVSKVYRWDQSGVADTGLTVNYQYYYYYSPFILSADGRVALVMGSGADWQNVHPCRLSPSIGSEISNISLDYSHYIGATILMTADGAVGCFSGVNGVVSRAYRWANPGTPTDLGSVGTGGSTVTAMSPDGSILVGTSSGTHTMWTPDERFTFAPSASQYSPKQVTKVFYE